MRAVVIAVARSVASIFRSRMALQLEILALRHQLAVYHRAGRRPQLLPADRLLWAWLSRAWSGWQEALVFVQPRTVIARQRQRFRDHWTRLRRRGTLGRPPVVKEIRDLIRKISAANPTWGSPRILAERVAALGVEEVLSAPRSPWQSPYVERMIGSIRRECLDNVVVLHQRHLRRLRTAYFEHYHRWRCHQGLAMDSPKPRPIQSAEQGSVLEVAESGGLYRHYERWAA